MFQLPPTTAAPPSFGAQPQYQQPVQQPPVQQPPVQQPPVQQQVPPQNMNPGVGTLAPQPGVQQPAPQQQQYQNLATAMQQMPNPGFNYQNGGLQTRIGPQLRGMPGVVRPPPLLGPDPNNALSQGTRMPSLVR